MAFCENCGTKLGDGVRFCPGCGSAVTVTVVPDTPPPAGASGGAAPGPQVIAQQQTVQPVQSSGNSQIIKQGPLSYEKNLLKALKGTATVYNDRLEWKGDAGMTVVINFSEVSNVGISNIKQTLTVTLANTQKHSFSKPITAGDVAKQLAIGYLGSGNIIAFLAEWKSAIDIAMGRS